MFSLMCLFVNNLCIETTKDFCHTTKRKSRLLIVIIYIDFFFVKIIFDLLCDKYTPQFCIFMHIWFGFKKALALAKL